jgi:hypothetical protein
MVCVQELYLCRNVFASLLPKNGLHVTITIHIHGGYLSMKWPALLNIICIKFCVKLGKKALETCEILKCAFGEDFWSTPEHLSGLCILKNAEFLLEMVYTVAVHLHVLKKLCFSLWQTIPIVPINRPYILFGCFEMPKRCDSIEAACYISAMHQLTWLFP